MKYLIIFSFQLLLGLECFPQLKKPELFVETSAFVSAGKNAPFWLLSNQFGKYSNHWYNINYSLGAKSVFDTSKNIDYGYGVEIMNRIDDKYTIYPHELYLAAKLWFFDIHAGWREEIFGNAYPGLTSGNMLWSGNARPMPKLSIRVPEFTSVPFTKGFIEFKGNLAHGWFEEDRYVKGVLMHHKSLIGRIGGSLPINAHYGLHHFAQWGGESPNSTYGKMPSDPDAFWWILQAKESAPVDSLGGESLNRYGNHIGSRNIGLDYKTKKWKVGFYWQTIFEDTSGKAWRNVKDGLWGLFWESKKDNALIKAVTVEYLNTRDQSGPSHDPVPELTQGGGRDNYFNNYIYMNGWTSYDMTLGTPLITSQELNETRYPRVVNNRVEMFNIGINGSINNKQTYFLKLSHSFNYGWYTTPYDPDNPTTFDPVRESTSIFLVYNLYSEKLKGFVKLMGAADIGKMYRDNVGIGFSYKRMIVF